jgi:hypothetical protein
MLCAVSKSTLSQFYRDLAEALTLARHPRVCGNDRSAANAH